MVKTAFISHASPDEAIARSVTAHLERQAVRCWIAPRDVRPGADYGSEIIDGIASSAVFVLVLSAHANASRFVKREVERAVSKGKPVFTLRIEDVLPSRSLELFVSSTEWIDAWQPPIDAVLDRLVASIRSAASLHPVPLHPVPTARHAPPARGSGGAVAGPRRWHALAIAALLLVVAGLATLLLNDRFTTPPAAVPVASEAARPAARQTAAVPAPAPNRSDAATTGLAAIDPCPRSLAVNRELPTPFACRCSAQATAEGSVWGSDLYTDDSSLCRAALHAGAVSAQGGPISVVRSSGGALYVGTTRAGFKTSDYGAYPYSIRFEGTPAPAAGPGLCPGSIAINRDLPMPFSCRCTAEAANHGSVWGTDLYSDDSSLCRAAGPGRRDGHAGPQRRACPVRRQHAQRRALERLRRLPGEHRLSLTRRLRGRYLRPFLRTIGLSARSSAPPLRSTFKSSWRPASAAPAAARARDH